MVGFTFVAFGVLRAVLFFGTLLWLSRTARKRPIEPKPRSSQQVALGIILGIGAALFLGSLIAELGRAMAGYLVALTLGAVPLVLLAVGLKAGIRLPHHVTLPKRDWPELVLWMIAAWGFAIALPWGLRLAEFNLMQWLLIPPYPGALSIERTIYWGDRENDSDNIQMVLNVPDGRAVIVSMYSPLLEARGWIPGPKLPNERGAPHTFEFHRNGTPQWATLKHSFNVDSAAARAGNATMFRLSLDLGDRG